MNGMVPGTSWLLFGNRVLNVGKIISHGVYINIRVCSERKIKKIKKLIKRQQVGCVREQDISRLL